MPSTQTTREEQPQHSSRADRLPTGKSDTAEQRSPLKSPQRGDIIALTDNSHPDLTNYTPRKILYTVETIDASDFVHTRTHDGSEYITPLNQWPSFAQGAEIVWTHSEERPLIPPGLDRAACAEERERERVGQGRHAPVPDPVTGLSPRGEPAQADDPRAQPVPGASGSHKDPQPAPPRDTDPPAGTSGPKMPDKVEPKAEGAPGPVGSDSPAGKTAQQQAAADKEERERRGTSAKLDDTKTAEHSKSPDKDDKSSRRG